jgi:hypothetical protein
MAVKASRAGIDKMEPIINERKLYRNEYNKMSEDMEELGDKISGRCLSSNCAESAVKPIKLTEHSLQPSRFSGFYNT